MAYKRRGDDHPPGRVAQAPRTSEQNIDINKDFNDAFYRNNALFIDPCLPILNSSSPRNDHLLNLMSSVFSSLVEEDNELDRRYVNMPQKHLREVLRPPPVLTLMEEALRSGDWTAVRAKFRPQKELSPNAENAAGDAFATQGAWKTPYHGDYARLMRDTLNTMNIKRHRSDVYANFVPIVQSSGTGKSRTVDEVAKLLITLPLCLRRAGEEGYPYADASVRDRLITLFDLYGTSSPLAQMGYLYFFTVLFILAAEQISRVAAKNRGLRDKALSLSDLAEVWRTHLANDESKCRRELYDEAVHRSRILFDDYLSGKENAIEEIFKGLNLTLQKDPVTEQGLDNLNDDSKTAASSSDVQSKGHGEDTGNEKHRVPFNVAQTSVSRAANYISQVINENIIGELNASHIRLLIYVDEAQSLMNLRKSEKAVGDDLSQHTYTNPAPPAAYHALCSVINAWSAAEIFTVFLSTNSHLSRLSPARQFWFSSRTRERTTDHVQAPITEMPFDVWGDGSKATIMEDDITLAGAVAPEVMVRFGRPLWWTRWDNSNYEIQKDIFKYAQAKLLGENRLDANRRALSMTSTAELAVLGERVLLNFEPRRILAIDIENELVEGYMRIAYSVPKHREFLYSGASSEPVLAEAAAQLMNGPDFSQIWPRRLARHVETGIIDKGQAGELAFRLILTLAHDVAVRLLPRNEDDVKQWDVPIPLDVFLVALFGKENAERVLESHPDNVPEGQTLREAFKGAKVRFSHFVQAYDATIVTDEAIWAALARGMAFQCYSTQAIIDIIIPLLLWDKKLGRHVVSAIFVQVKNTSKEKKPEIKVESLKIFSEEGADEKSKRRPYITLVVNLGVHRPKSDAAKGLTKVPSSQSSSSGKSLSYDMPSTSQQRLETPNKFGVGIPPSGRLSKARKTKQARKYSTHHRYAMEITGCSPTVYPYVVTPDQSNYFAQLLGRRELIDEHPRQTERALRSVLQLKPYWSCKLRSFNWAGRSPGSESSRPAFQEDYPEEDLPDTVKVVSFVEEGDGDGDGEGEKGEEGEEDWAD